MWCTTDYLGISSCKIYPMFKVRIVADLEARVADEVKREGISEDKAGRSS